MTSSQIYFCLLVFWLLKNSSCVHSGHIRGGYVYLPVIKNKTSINSTWSQTQPAAVRGHEFLPIWLGQTSLSLFHPLSFFLVRSSTRKFTVSKRALVGEAAFILHLRFALPLTCSSWVCLVFHSSSTHSPTILCSFPPTNYLQDYRFSVDCDWVSLGVMRALRCLLNGERHELWPNYSYSSTTLEPQWDMGSSLMQKNIPTHTQSCVCVAIFMRLIAFISHPLASTFTLTLTWLLASSPAQLSLGLAVFPLFFGLEPQILAHGDLRR